MKTDNVQATSQPAVTPDLVDAILLTGTDWARHGIGLGISAVRGHADLFRILSTTLERAADAIATAAEPILAEPAGAPAASDGEVVETTATETAAPRRKHPVRAA